MTDVAESERNGGVSGRRHWVAFALLIFFTEVAALLVYVSRPNARVTNPWLMLYPFVWIDVSLAALVGVWLRRTVDASPEMRWVAALVTLGYFLVLGYFGGLYGFFGSGGGLAIDAQLPPGASPAFLYNGHPLVLVLQPYKVVGYLTLTYLVYRTLLRATGAGSAVSGVVGLFSCVSCSWPLIGLAFSVVFGSSSAVASVALTHDYLISTAIFLSSVALLYWRPSFRWNPLRRLPGT